jgi:nitrite reductase (NADH) small subunit
MAMVGEAMWIDICALEDIVPGTAVAAMLFGVQVALVRPRRGAAVYALSNFDPFSRAFVIARGIVGDRNGEPKIASPIYKQNFSLETGRCLDDPKVRLPVYATRIAEGRVEIDVAPLWRRRR